MALLNHNGWALMLAHTTPRQRQKARKLVGLVLAGATMTGTAMNAPGQAQAAANTLRRPGDPGARNGTMTGWVGGLSHRFMLSQGFQYGGQKQGPQGMIHEYTHPTAGSIAVLERVGNTTGTDTAMSQPSDNVSAEKAKQILKDNSAQGHPLTDAQRRMFGAAAGGR